MLKIKNTRLAALLFFAFLPAAGAFSPEKEPMTKLLETVNKSALETASSRKIRLAVIPLKTTGSSRFEDAGFGAYLTEKISSSLSSAGPQIRLFERTLLESVLKEQSLSASGVIDKSEALKIGELAPIDYILTGTFTRLEGFVEVNLRFIDVVSGEVRGNFSEKVGLTPELSVLFTEKTVNAGETGNQVGCEKGWSAVRELMEDIGSEEKVKKLTGEALKIPFEEPCGKIHYEVMDLLSKYKIYPPAYGRFLLGTLKKIESPDKDRRAGALVDYLLSPERPEPGAWEESLRVASLSAHFYDYAEILLSLNPESEASRKLLRERTGIIMKRVEENKVGRPVPLKAGPVFLNLMETLSEIFLSPYGKKDPGPLMDFYQSYGSKYSDTPYGEMFKMLIRMYKSAENPADREKIAGWLCERMSSSEPSRETADEFAFFMNGLLEAKKENLKAGGAGGRPAQELNNFSAFCGRGIASLAPFITGREYRLNIIAFCLENGIKGETIPDEASLELDLISEDNTRKTEAIRLLKALGPAASKAEPAALKLLRRSEDQYIRHDLLGLLGVIRTSNPEAHKLMLEQLLDLESYLADEAVLAFAAVGEPAAAFLKGEYPKIEEDYKKMRVLKIFQLRGKDAAGHRSWLKSIIDSAESKYVRAAAEDALEAVSKK